MDVNRDFNTGGFNTGLSWKAAEPTKTNALSQSTVEAAGPVCVCLRAFVCVCVCLIY